MNKNISDEIDKLKERIEKWPYNSKEHDELIDLLRTDKNSRMKDLQGARKYKTQFFCLSSQEIGNWFEDLVSIEDIDYRISSTIEFYRILVQDYPTTEYWSRYLEFVISNYDQTQILISETDLKEIFKEALNDTVHDFKNSKDVWEIVLSYFNRELDSSGKKEDFDTLLKLHLKRISFPHESLRESFSQLSSFISKYDSERYEQHMLASNKVFSKTLKAQRYYEKFEIEILKRPEDPKVWIDYMGLVNKYASEVSQVSTLFYRSITSGGNRPVDDPTWISTWLTYIYILYQESIELKMVTLEPILLKFIRSYPTSAVSYAEYIRNCIIFEDGVEIFKVLKKRIIDLDLMRTNSYDNWKVLALAILSYEFSLVHKENNIDLVSDLYTDATDYVELALENNNDIFHSVEKLVVSIYETLDDIEQARSVITRLLERFNDQCEVWLYAFEFERRNNSSYQSISSLLQRAMDNSQVLDWPERIIQEWLSYEQVHGSIHSYENSLVLADKKIREMSLTRIHIQEAETAESQSKALEINKSNGEDLELDQPQTNSTTDPPRNREELSVKISNLPQNITENTLTNFFGDCGTPKEIKLFQENSLPEAIIEWNDSKQVFASLTKTMKIINGSEVLVTRILQNTVWVCNFPPSFTHDKIKDIFEKVGNVVSIRFPSLKSNQSRRFCYVEYATPEIAQVAILKYHGKEFEDDITHKKFSLVVNISKPQSKMKDEVPEIGREVYVQNLNFKSVTDTNLENLFKLYGAIENIKVPINDKMKEKGNVNCGYAFVLFKSSVAAKNALLLDGTFFQNRKILVTQSQRKRKTNSNEDIVAGRFGELNTISIFNVSDTINQSQMTNFLTQKIGPVRHVEIFPKHEAVLAEFEHASDSGKASMLLTSESLEGKTLLVGLKGDLNRILLGAGLPSKKQKLMVPPTLQRRRHRK